jgi:transposase InsO family protein
VSRFQFVADHRDTFEVKRLCEVIEVNRSSFYAWGAAAPARAERAADDEQLAERIRVVHEADKAYGAPRITAELNDGVPLKERVNRKRIARVMAKHDIAGTRLRRRVRTTIPEPSDQKVPDLLKRDFTAETPNTKYVGDITYLPLADGSNLYLATVIDCCSRKLAGWALADRGSLRGAIFHADHGAQYTSKDYARLCGQLGVAQSLGGVGSSADNALAESFNATMKREVLAGAPVFADQASCRRQIFRWATRYNTRRRHSYLGQQAPNTYENQLAATLPEAA